MKKVLALAALLAAASVSFGQGYVNFQNSSTTRISTNGTAVALAISQPVLLDGQSFAVRGGWGDFQGQNAFGVSAAGVIARNSFGYGSTVTLDAGFGVGTQYSGAGGKAGVTIGFGGTAPLK